ncbi:MAG: hypothetical protein HQM04_08740 [Magnetococcales bacterium]|nr:hypothetical protein [Magnetococcales bacterium]MBF0115119.1 hypothetical protein [Magnetococcales bacterium]
MAQKDNYTVEQLERIRATLGTALGDKSAQALEVLETRFSAAPDVSEEDEKLMKLREKMDNPSVDVTAIIATGRLPDMIAGLDKAKSEPDKQQRLVTAILNHKDAKPPSLVEALGKVTNRRELVEDLVGGIVAQRGVNPLIESLRYATISPTAYGALAKGIAEQGTVNHLIRTIATAPRGQADAELMWSMEIMRKGTLEQLLEAMNLLDDSSPGIVALASGVANRKDVGVEPMVRGLSFCKNNAKASAILALELTRVADLNAVVVILEKYISDGSDAGEILVTKLVHRTKFAKNREPLLIKACRFMRGDSMAGKILAMGLNDLNDGEKFAQAHSRLSSHLGAQKVMAVGIARKLGPIKGVSMLGKEYFKVSSYQPEVDALLKEAKQRYEWILKEVLNEDPSARPEPDSAKSEAGEEEGKKK